MKPWLSNKKTRLFLALESNRQICFRMYKNELTIELILLYKSHIHLTCIYIIFTILTNKWNLS